MTVSRPSATDRGVSGPTTRRRHGTVALALVLAMVSWCLSATPRQPTQDAAYTPTASGYESAVTVPEHPEGAAFNPTQIKDIQAASPAAGINLIQAPVANNQGDARLGYPLEVPGGRNGMQPELALSYSSSGGDTWAGVGWDLTVPAITIDTRWGVPRYDDGLETETYLLGGEQLTPVAHRGAPRPRSAEKVFHTRVEGAFSRIVRHGDSPDTYTWEVTTKEGMTQVYGAAPGTTLADDQGHRAVWALAEVRDPHGNFIRYHYATVTDAGVPGSTVQGRNLYPAKITWTGHGSTEGRYSVTFQRDRERGETRRTDVGIDARLGFKRVTADLLRRVDVRFDDQLIRAYELDYTAGAFGKTLLASVSQRGSDNELFHTHTFDYFDDIRDSDGGYQAFSGPTGWTMPDDHLGRPIGGDEGEASALSASTSVSHGGHFYAGWNPATASKKNSGGVKVGHNLSQSDGLLALTDLNGDNLPDKVFRSSGDIYYRPNLSGPTGAARFGDAVKLSGLPDISRERSISGTAGLESYFGGVAAQIDYVYTSTSSDRYLSDVNGDGISDLVRNGGVLFGHLDADGRPAYSGNSFDTPVPVGQGTVSGSVMGDQTAEFQQQVEAFPLLDGVRRWVAPYDGTVRIDGGVRLVEDTSTERAEYRQADGVRVTIQHEDAELWAARIGPDDHVEHAPSGVDSVAVKKGEAVYFRVQSVLDGRYDAVDWDPRVSYTDLPPSTDVNGLDDLVYRASTDFTLGGRPSRVTAPLTGTVHLSGDARKSATTTDDVTVEVTRNGTAVFTRKLAAGESGTAALDLDLAVEQGDTLGFRLRADSPVDLATLSWVPVAAYTSAEGLDSVTDENGDPTVMLQAPYDVDMYPATTLTAPQRSWTADTEDLTVRPSLSFEFGATTPDTTVVFTVKRRGALLAKQSIEIVDGVVPEIPALALTAAPGDELFFDFSTLDPTLLGALRAQGVTVNGASVPSALHAAAEQGVFAQPYRGWAAVGYQGNKERATAPIHQADLVPTQPTRTTEVTEDDLPAEGEAPRVEAPKVVVLAPVPAEHHWGGADENTWVSADGASSSRLGLDTIDVASDAEYAGASAVDRRSRTTQLSATFGASVVGGSLAKGKSVGRLDFLDLNGDRFPDAVGSGGIQYSDMIGGLGTTRGSLGGQVRQSTTRAYTVSGNAGSPANTNAGSRGQAAPSGTRNANTARSGSQMPSLGIGGSLGGGDSDTDYDLLDVNGDGLPDKVYGDGDAALNLGYSFAGREPWRAGPVNDGETRNASISGNAGYNRNFYEFAGGVSATLGTSWTDASLQDMNGDGLLDKVHTLDGEPVAVGINTGSGFVAPTAFAGARQEIAKDENASLGGGLYFTWGFCTGYAGCFVFNLGADAAASIGRSEVALRDVNGDGYVDHVRSTSDDELLVSENRTGRTNLLRSVTRPLGATIELDYARSGNTYDQPDSRWVLAKTVVHDAHAGDGQSTLATTYAYEHGVQSRLEREFLGYSRVVTRQLDAGSDNAVYRATIADYRTDSYYTKGLVARTLTTDAADRPYVETGYTYQLRDVSNGEPADRASTTATVFPMLTRQESRFYEGQATAGKTTYTETEYDDLGNVVRILDAGDEGSEDDLETLVGYSSDPACRDRNLLGVATSSRARHDGAVLRHSEATLNCATGDLTQVRDYLGDGTAAVTDLTYDALGNLATVTDPANTSGQRVSLTFGYDAEVHQFVESIVDDFGYRTTTSHDLRFGQPVVTTDENGQQVKQSWDRFGRLSSVTGPYEIDEDRLTIAFDYHPEAETPYAVSRHVDRTATGVRDDTIDTVLFVDGLGRVVQTKKDASVAATAGDTAQEVMTVSGRTTYDFAGRVVAQTYPVTEPKGSANLTLNTTIDPVAPTRTQYDVMDRPIATTLPDSTSTKLFYGFGSDRSGTTRFLTVSTDANGKQRRVFLDVRGLTTAVKEFNPAGNQPVIWTSYQYDPLGQIAKVTDDHGNVTSSEYDALGRRTAVVSPDSGRTESRFDLAGNLVAKVTAKLAPRGQAIQYDYDHDRLTAIRYPVFTGNNVTFAYGAPGAPDNAANRVTKVTDAAGTLTRKYGPLGEVVSETRVVTAIRTPARTYTTSYQYDAFNRVLDLTYPDGEVLTYDYDSGGSVRRATGVKGDDSYTYLARLDYDKFGQRVLQETGTGVRTTYTYDAEDRQLTNLSAKLPDGYQFQNLKYGYDRVGNVMSLTNAVTQQDGKPIGGASQQTFEYDDLYRLSAATGKYQKSDNKVDSYSMSLSYDTIHNTLSKTQRHQIEVGETFDPTIEESTVEPSPEAITLDDGTTYLPPLGPIEEPAEPTTATSTDETTAGTTGGTSTAGTQVQKDTTYDYAYTYGGRPHAPTKVGPNEQSYDANGNLVDELNTLPPAPGKRRQFVWDEENRLACNQDHSRNTTVAQAPETCSTPKQPPTVRYVYDADGNRVVKDSGQVSIYPNRAYSERNGTAFKHVYIGDSLLATKTVKPDSTYENQQFYFHADHLGSSAFVSDEHGQLTEHLEYFAFGETWVNEHPAQPTAMPYHYGGKELDDETGLYYYGARYYNPRTQLWASPDPILSSYLDGGPNGGVYNPANLASYTYAYGNPVKFTDPDGMAVTWSDIGHTTLDVVGLVPGVGEAADLANAAWYAGEGDYTNAALSAASAVPFAGYAATAAKWGKRAVGASTAAIKSVEASRGAAKLVTTAAAATAKTVARVRPWVAIGKLDALGRATGVRAMLTKEMLATGSRASSRIRPPGFGGGAAGHARAHLLADILGASGKDARNLVTMFQRANKYMYDAFEGKVQKLVEAGQNVYYSATPIYRGNELAPIAIELRAVASDGTEIAMSILNKAD